MITLPVIICAALTYLAANYVHGRMPAWYYVVCLGVWMFASQIPHPYLQFEIVSILGCVAILRDYIKKGLLR